MADHLICDLESLKKPYTVTFSGVKVPSGMRQD